MDDPRSALIASLDEANRELSTLAKSLTPAELDLPTENEGWSVKDTLSHTAASGLGMIALVKRAIGGEPAPSPNSDLATRNQQQVEQRRARSIDELLAEAVAVKREAVSMLGSLTDEQLALEGRLSSGKPIRVVDAFRKIGDHQLDHAQQIRKAIGR